MPPNARPDTEYPAATLITNPAWTPTNGEFRRLINEGEYDYLITSQATQDSPEADYYYPVYAWLKTDPALKLEVEEPDITPQPDYVFKVEGKLDESCADVGKG